MSSTRRPRPALSAPRDAGRRAATAAVRAPGVLLRLVGRLTGLFGAEAGARQALLALGVNSLTSLVAGAVLGAITGTLRDIPGLLVLVPAAIGLRGNVFSALGSRLSTAVHTGTFTLARRRDTVLGQNVMAATVLTLGMAVVLAVLAKFVAVALNLPGSASVLDLALVSILGGALASVIVMAATIALTAGAARHDWDLDNLVAPVVSTLGDVLTLPALWLSAQLVGFKIFTPVLSITVIGATALVSVVTWQTSHEVFRSIVRQSVPVLVLAGVLSTLAGIVMEKRLETFTRLPALLVLIPAFVSSAGALGGILTSRVSTGIHLGTHVASPLPDRATRHDASTVIGLAVPIFALNGLGAHFVARVLGQASPGLLQMMAATAIGGAFVLALVTVLAYYAAVVSVRVGVDPDTAGIPIVTSSVDFAGALALVAALVIVGIV